MISQDLGNGRCVRGGKVPMLKNQGDNGAGKDKEGHRRRDDQEKDQPQALGQGLAEGSQVPISGLPGKGRECRKGDRGDDHSEGELDNLGRVFHPGDGGATKMGSQMIAQHNGEEVIHDQTQQDGEIQEADAAEGRVVNGEGQA